jgi:hypothetical protein
LEKKEEGKKERQPLENEYGNFGEDNDTDENGNISSNIENISSIILKLMFFNEAI